MLGPVHQARIHVPVPSGMRDWPESEICTASADLRKTSSSQGITRKTEAAYWSVKHWYSQFLHWRGKGSCIVKRFKELASGIATCACIIAANAIWTALSFMTESTRPTYALVVWEKAAGNGLCGFNWDAWDFCLCHRHFGNISSFSLNPHHHFSFKKDRC